MKLLVIIALILYVTPAFAIDTSVDTQKSIKTDKEKSQSLKKSQEQKDTKGKKKSDTASIGRDKTDSDTIKAIGQAMSSAGADITMPLEVVFLDRIAEFEKDTNPFAQCKVVTAPKPGRDFGLSAEVRPGVIDTIKADYLAKAAQSSSYIADIADEQGIRSYRDCLAYYGAVIAQAYIYLTQDLQDLKVSVTKSRNGEINVKGMGYEDFILLADAALQKALQGFTNGTIKKVYERIVNDIGACQFDRSVENIKCGSSLITLGTIPKLAHGGIHVYGGQYMGYQGSYKLSKSWSYQDAIEKLKATSKYSKWAAEVAKYSEELESQGRTKEATMVRKKAWEIAKSGKQTVNVSQLLQPVH
jgi:hypothetical protein